VTLQYLLDVEGLVARIIRRTGHRANKEQRTDQDDEESFLRHASMLGLGQALVDDPA
jgi:hypothetical protein